MAHLLQKIFSSQTASSCLTSQTLSMSTDFLCSAAFVMFPQPTIGSERHCAFGYAARPSVRPESDRPLEPISHDAMFPYLVEGFQ